MTLQESFEGITDNRVERCKKHNLVDILMIVFIGMLCGHKSIELAPVLCNAKRTNSKKIS